KTGIVKDRCNVRASDKSVLGSIAATGFGLTALCIGEKRGYISYAQARDRALTALRFFWKKMPNERGFYYHWANISTGERLWQSEVSSVDTSILLCGILTCRQYFQHSEISQLAQEIFNRVDWRWLSEDTRILPHGWTPEGGFLQYRWDSYSEMMMMYLLGLGSSSHALPPQAWDAWKRTTFEFDGIHYIGSYAPLFVHQYSQAWFDFRGKRDKYADYFQNSILATDVHRRFCLSLANKFSDYSENLWGITASDSEHGYEVWGGPPATGPIDGTVVPCASAGSIPFLPGPVMRVLRNIQYRYGAGTWSRYGFVDAFNPRTNWYDSDIVGIDSGISMVMAENARTAFVWDTFMKNPEAQRGMERAGFKSYKPSSPQELVEMHSRPGQRE
ncbi:MAG TPA: glucoamylase family protein, partial [Candidatus Acidoferrales bacterium]|nr:glucoamylase family protein [Candidatus Acidoferrales bacterium]